MPKLLTIAVDFDGTLVENEYPGIGKPILFAFETLRKLQQEGHLIILWTYRSGKKLEEAINFCSLKGLEFYAVNKSFPEEEYDPGLSRKILADIFIDDRNLNGLPPWGEIYHALSFKKPEAPKPEKKKTNGLVKLLKKLK